METAIDFLPGFSVLGFIFGSCVLVIKYRREFPGAKDTWGNRMVLLYDIMTTMFITIGIGLSISLAANRIIGSECRPYNCIEVMAELTNVTDKLREAERDINDLEHLNEVYRRRLDERIPTYGSEWIMRAANRIVSLADNPNITIEETQVIIEEEFTSGL